MRELVKTLAIPYQLKEAKRVIRAAQKLEATAYAQSAKAGKQPPDDDLGDGLYARGRNAVGRGCEDVAGPLGDEGRVEQRAEKVEVEFRRSRLGGAIQLAIYRSRISGYMTT